MSIEEKLTIIQNAFGHLQVWPAISYSIHTKKWYVTTNYAIFKHVKDFGDVTFGEHKKTPEEAVDAFLEEMKNAEYVYAAQMGDRKSVV